MDNLKNNIKDIAHNYYMHLMSLENVRGVGLGLKEINNIKTIEPCIKVLVKDKIDLKFISKNNIVPKSYMGIKTDVIEVGEFASCGGEAIPGRFRPLIGGCGIGLYDSDQECTLACIVTKGIFRKQYFILSNNHTIADLNEAAKGLPIIQPSKDSEDVEEDDIVARLSTFIRLKFIDINNINLNDLNISEKDTNVVDCAIAKITKKTLISNEIFHIGKVKGVSQVELNSKVHKVGFVSGFSEGVVDTIYTTTLTKFKSKWAFFKDQTSVRIKTMSGDSGSLVLNKNNEAVGLYFANTPKGFGLMNDINVVLKKLKVKIYTG